MINLKKICEEKGLTNIDIGEFGDGFHTFNSLYHQRLILFAALVNTYSDISWKTKRHEDGEECFGGGWFLVGINTPDGPSTYHYELKDWDLFKCEVLDRAPEWDGHTDKDVERLLSLDPSLKLELFKGCSMIKIHKNPNGDTRTAPKNVTFEEFKEANDSHILDVRRVLKRFADVVIITGLLHDFTKKSYELEFYNDFKDTLENGSNFVEGEWYKMHIEKERHHLLSRCPDDVNLLDVIEMIVDCVCAGKARSGEVPQLEISDDILRLAVKNTVKWTDVMTEVED